MSEPSTETLTLDRSVDHLGFIERTLAELSGYRTLAFELIQNADDAGEAATIRFNVTDDALVVEDDGGFSDCGHQEDLAPDECPFLDQYGHRCDFHSFRLISGGDKQAREATTGAFGIGFIAVYQLTDRPELFSGTWHWAVNETRDGGKIEAERLDPPCEGTRVVLPYAFDPASGLRQALNVEAVPPDVTTRLLDVLEDAIPAAILFTRNLTRAELWLDGEAYRVWHRADHGDDLVITTEDQVLRWRLLHGSFDDGADELRTRHPGKIELERGSGVTIALPIGHDIRGTLCATLPTEEHTGLPLHINADFYPSSDRRRLEMQAAHHAAWNAAAIGAAARVLAEELSQVRDVLGADRFWRFIDGAHKLTQAQENDLSQALAQLWNELEADLREAEIVRTHDEDWVTTADAVVPENAAEHVAAEVLTALGLKVVSHASRQYFPLLRHLGVSVLAIQHVAEAAKHEAGLDESTALDADAPPPFDLPETRAILWGELALLAGRSKVNEAATELADAALLPARDGVLSPTRALRHADDATADLFARCGVLEVGFLDDLSLGEHAAQLRPLVRPFSVQDAVIELEAVAEHLGRMHDDGRLGSGEMIRWLADRSDEVDSDLRERIRRLPIFPTSSGARRLSEVALPGGFTDELGLAQVMDSDAVGAAAAFVAFLGAEELTFSVYARKHLPAAFATGDLPRERRHRAVEQLATRMGELRDDPVVLDALAATPLAECHDAEWRKPTEVYFDDVAVRNVLGDGVAFASGRGERAHAVSDLLELLGCARDPRPIDVVRRAEHLSRLSPTPSARADVERIVAWTGREYPRLEIEGSLDDMASLRSLPWLPATGEDQWHAPGDLFSTFQRFLFESQGAFLDISQRIQGQATEFLKWLGVRDQPTVDLVVGHVLASAEQGARVNPEVYAFLNRNADDPALAPLEGAPCLAIDRMFLQPAKVFWGAHSFGRWRFQLGPEFRNYQALLNRLNVDEHPNHEDAKAVLLDMEQMIGETNDKLDDDDLWVNRTCWEMLAEALDAETISEHEIRDALGTSKVVVDSRGVLMRPGFVYFEDFPGIAEHLPAINNHVIRRPPSGWTAMLAAGVRNLSQEARADIVDVVPVDDRIVRERVAERAAQLARVLSAAMSLSADFRPRLEALTFSGATSLTIAWSLTVVREFRSAELSVPAIWSGDDIWVVVRDGRPVWQAVARELVRALLPGHEPGNLALALAAALDAPTLQAAIEALDAAGVPRLADELLAPAVAASAVSFDVADTDDGIDPASVTSTEQAGGATTLHASEGDGKHPGSSGGSIAENGTARRKGTGLHPGADAARGGGSAAAEHGGHSASRGTDVGGRKQAGEWDGTSRSRLRSYVAPVDGDTAEAADEDPAVQERRREIDQAAVSAVVEYESEAGRDPEVMGHSNRGYDIESKNESGDIVRYIEVKGTASSWDAYGVGITASQFAFALEAGPDCWLYVVERALDPDQRRVHVIRDPANTVSRFMFDDAWKGLAE